MAVPEQIIDPAVLVPAIDGVEPRQREVVALQGRDVADEQVPALAARHLKVDDVVQRDVLGDDRAPSGGIMGLRPADGAPRPKRQRTSLSGKRLRVVDQVFRSGNPRVPHTHGWLAFEVLRRAEGGTLLFEEYERRLFHPAPEIREEASKILGVNGAYQHLKHIKHDIAKGRVMLEDAS